MAFSSARASYTSTTVERTPSVCSAAAFSADRVVPVTVCPASRSSGTSRRPITPVAPARKMFIGHTPPRSGDRRVHLRGVVVLVELDRLAVREPPGVDLRRPHHLAGLLELPGAAAEHDDAIALRHEMADLV